MSSSGSSIPMACLEVLDFWQVLRWKGSPVLDFNFSDALGIHLDLTLLAGPRLGISASSAFRLPSWISTYVDSLDIGPERLRSSVWL